MKKGKIWFILKILILIATISTSIYAGYHWVLIKRFTNIATIGGGLIFFAVVFAVLWIITGIISLIVKRRVIVHKFAGYMILMCILFPACAIGSLLLSSKMLGVDTTEIEPDNALNYEEDIETDWVGKYNDISSGWLNPETGTYYYGEIMSDPNEIVGTSGETVQQILNDYGALRNDGKTYTLTKYYCKTTDELVYCVTSSGGGSQILREDGVKFAILAKSSTERMGADALERFLKNYKMSENMAKAFGGGNTNVKGNGRRIDD